MRYRSAILAVTAVAAAGLVLRVLHDLSETHAGIAPLALMSFAVAAFIDAEW